MTDGDDRRRINEAIRPWRQGDFVRGRYGFLFRISPDKPLTVEAELPAHEGFSAAEADVIGFMVLTQSCDIIRDCKDRPFVQVSPLVEVEEQVVHEVRRGYRPRFAWVPGFAGESLVADLDQVMTVEKSVVAAWTRNPGCKTEQDAHRLALMLSRKLSRPAFPNDFTIYAESLENRISSKHDRDSEEGRALGALDEIRVRAAPSWVAPKVELTFYFIRNPDVAVFDGTGWDSYLQRWLNLLPTSERYTAYGVVLTLDDLTARDYVESDPLDLDYLSARGP